MGLTTRQLDCGGFQHDYQRWKTHRREGDRPDSWGPSDLPSCPDCYPFQQTERKEDLRTPALAGAPSPK